MKMNRSDSKWEEAEGWRLRERSEVADSASGFTLLELLASLTILTFIMLAIGQFFFLASNAWEKGEAETVWTQRMRVLSGMLSQQIKSAFPYKMKIDDEEIIVFKGDAGSIMFVTTSVEPAYGGLKWIRYSYKDGELLLKEGLLPDKKLDNKLSGDEEVVDPDIEEIRFSYYSVDEAKWNDSWDYGENLPGVVKVEISGFLPFLINLPLGLAQNQDEKAGTTL